MTDRETWCDTCGAPLVSYTRTSSKKGTPIKLRCLIGHEQLSKVMFAAHDTKWHAVSGPAA